MDYLDIDNCSIADLELDFPPSTDLQTLFPELDDNDWRIDEFGNVNFDYTPSADAMYTDSTLSNTTPTDTTTPITSSLTTPVDGVSHSLPEELPLLDNDDVWSTNGCEVHIDTCASVSPHATTKKHRHKRVQRLPQPAINILKSWYNTHRGSPYPSEAERKMLECKTGLTRNQISIWFANKRRRDPAKAAAGSDAATKGSMLPPPVPLPPQADLSPYQRWKMAPIETEHPPVPTIRANALEIDHYEEPESYSRRQIAPSELIYPTSQADEVNRQAVQDSASTIVSYDTGRTSYQLSTASQYSGTRDRRRRRATKAKTLTTASSASVSAFNDEGPTPQRPYQCTFCQTHTFKTKHDWQRHEKAVHLGLDTWICCPSVSAGSEDASGLTIDSAGRSRCAFCSIPDPDARHLNDTHNFQSCDGKPLSERTFYRKDHFSQHLRVVHNTKMTAELEKRSRQKLAEVLSRCGFCGVGMRTWQERVDHIAKHYRDEGRSMADWVGDWGFEPAVLGMVERAVVPGQGQGQAQMLLVQGQNLLLPESEAPPKSNWGFTVAKGGGGGLTLAQGMQDDPVIWDDLELPEMPTSLEIW